MAIDYKPEQSDYKNLTPFKRWLVTQINTWGINNFPFLESDFDKLTNYGMMMKLMKAMNDVISNQNLVETDMNNLFNAFTELQTYINNYFDTLDLQDEVDNKLDEMASNGQLESIFSSYFNKINEKLNFKRIYSEVLNIRNLNDNTDYQYAHIQSLVYIDSSHIIISRSNVDTINTGLIQLINPTNGNVYREVTGNFYSDNDICYDKTNKVIYVCSGRTVNTITAIDYNTFEIIETYTLSYTPQMIAFDNDNNYLIVAERITGLIRRYEVNSSLELIDSFGITNPSYIENGAETIDYIDNKLIFSNIAPNRLIIYDYTTHEFIKEILLEQYSVDRFNLGEFQACSIDTNGDIYLCSDLWLGNSTNETMIQIFKGNIYKNNVNYIDTLNNIFYTSQIINNIYVDNSNDEINPIGTQTHPFRSINEALAFVEGIQEKNFIINIIKTSEDYNPIFMSSKNVLRLICNEMIKIVGMSYFRGVNLTVENIEFENNNNYLLQTQNSNIKFINCKFTLEDNNTHNGIYLIRTDCYLDNITENINKLFAVCEYSNVLTNQHLAIYSGNSSNKCESYLYDDTAFSCIEKPSNINFFKNLIRSAHGNYSYVNVAYRNSKVSDWKIIKTINRSDLTLQSLNVNGTTSTGNDVDINEATINLNGNNIAVTNYTSNMTSETSNDLLIRQIWLSNY